jgi:hypothetical protein
MTAAVRATTYNEHIMLTETNPIPNQAASRSRPLFLFENVRSSMKITDQTQTMALSMQLRRVGDDALDRGTDLLFHIRDDGPKLEA